MVPEDAKVIGMVTDRDLCMAAYWEGKSFEEIPVSTAMSDNVWTCSPDDSLNDAIRMMQAHQVRRLPVTDEQGRLVGVISLSDLAQEAARERGLRTKRLEDMEIVQLLSAVCEPRHAEVSG